MTSSASTTGHGCSTASTSTTGCAGSTASTTSRALSWTSTTAGTRSWRDTSPTPTPTSPTIQRPPRCASTTWPTERWSGPRSTACDRNRVRIRQPSTPGGTASSPGTGFVPARCGWCSSEGCRAPASRRSARHWPNGWEPSCCPVTGFARSWPAWTCHGDGRSRRSLAAGSHHLHLRISGRRGAPGAVVAVTRAALSGLSRARHAACGATPSPDRRPRRRSARPAAPRARSARS